MPPRNQVSTLGEMYARAQAQQQRHAYRHDMNYEWYCPEHMVRWTGFITSSCWIVGCETTSIKWAEAVRLEWAGRYRTNRGETSGPAV